MCRTQGVQEINSRVGLEEGKGRGKGREDGFFFVLGNQQKAGERK